jgi:hypothetical protein
MNKRAVTTTQKELILHRLLEVWDRGNNKQLRLGQLIENAAFNKDLFYMEDLELADAVEKFGDAVKDAEEKLKAYMPEKQRKAEFNSFTYSRGKNPNCEKCHGEGSYMYDENHGKPCELCCDHKTGYRMMKIDYDKHGKKKEPEDQFWGIHAGWYNCAAGCGLTKNKLEEGEVEVTNDE